MVAAVEWASAVHAVWGRPALEAHAERMFIAPVRHIRDACDIVHQRVVAIAVLVEAAIVLAPLLGAGRATVLTITDALSVIALAKATAILRTAAVGAV